MKTVLHYLDSDSKGGGPKNIQQIVRALSGLGSQVVATSGLGNLSLGLEKATNIRFCRLMTFPPFLSFFRLVELCWLLHRHRPDLVITYGQWGGFWMGLILPVFPRVRSIYFAGWSALYEMTDAYRAARNHCFEKIAFSNHSRVVCLSESNVRLFLVTGVLPNRNKIVVIPVPTTRTPLTETPGRSSSGPMQFLYLGRLDRQKKPDWLLESWHRAQKLGLPPAKLLIAGEGPWKETVQKLIDRWQLSSSVELLGYVEGVTDLLQRVDCLITTSLYEGHANVVLESAEVGKPVLAMFADGVVDSFAPEDYDKMAPLGDTETMAKLIQRTAVDPSFYRDLQLMAQKKLPFFAEELVMQKYVSLARELLGDEATQDA